MDDAAVVKPAARRRPRAEPAPSAANAIDIAMELERRDPSPDSPARTLLVKQGRLLDVQLKLAHRQLASETVAVAVRLGMALGVCAAVLAAAALVWDARNARGLVIEAFSVPPAMAARGLTGEVIAAQLQDRIVDMQTRTQSGRAAETFANNWGSDIAVEIPQTGVSIVELRRLLRGWLGRETRVSGSVAQGPGGLTVTARVHGQTGASFSGPEADLDALVERASEAVFARTQPYRYGAYLLQNDRAEEGAAVLQRILDQGPEEERPYALVGLGNVAPDPQAAAARLREAVELDPDLALGWYNLANIETALGHEEASLAATRSAVRLLQRADRGGFSRITATAALHSTRSSLAFQTGDFEGAIEHQRAIEAGPEYYGARAMAPTFRAEALARNHDVAGARALAARFGADDAAIALRFQAYGGAASPYYRAAVALDDWTEALRQLRGVVAVSPDLQAMRPTLVAPFEAEALARLGRTAEAAALLADTPRDCYGCVIRRGVVAAFQRDWPAADRWFAEAVRLAPTPPDAYAAWGEAKAARGDLDEAIELFRQTQKKAPRWADPLKLEADALTTAGKARQALGRYQAAARLAPRWGALHLAWGEALARLGRGEEAAAKWRAAAGMDLSPADRAVVTARLRTAAAQG